MTADEEREREARFAVAALRARVSDAVFARGEAYHRGGHVELLAMDARRVLARVAGTEIWRTELFGCGADVRGGCSCPAFEDWGFCKHMVATALAANAAEGLVASGEAAPEPAGATARIRAWLGAKPPTELVDMIVELGERDPALFRRLDVASAAVGGDVATLEGRLRKAIDAATRMRGFIDYDEAGGWATGVDEALDLIADAATAGRGAVALRLAERAMDRIEDAVGSIDDSDGKCSELLHRARDIHLSAARVCRPDPAPLARQLFKREMESGYDIFDGASVAYADVLAEPGLAEYRRLALEAWEALPPRPPGAPYDGETPYSRLQDILDGFAAGDGDVEARIALRTKDLSSPGRYIHLAEFCLAQGRSDEALRRAEEALWVFEDDRPDQRLVVFTAGLLTDAGRAADAEAVLWRAFEKAPSLDLYRKLRVAGGEAARSRAVALLENRIRDEPSTRWSHAADLLVQAHEHDSAFDAAWAAVQRHGASTIVKEALARSSEATHPRQALEVYGARVETLAGHGGHRSYEEAASLVARMATLRTAAEQAAWVSELKVRHRLKRNLMKLLG
jgi:tetratricopeptide (TPR) repeat protein